MDDEQREQRMRQLLMEEAKRAIALRSKDREFHGLEREFGYYQAEMLADYEKSKDIKHPRDVGASREEILRKFLQKSGYLPRRYAVSENSARVASTTGHLSKEIDILLYDPFDSVSLMRREDVYEVFPVESVYGVIQVKSRLNKREIKDGLANLASFKRLDRQPHAPWGVRGINDRKADRGFGLLFAYDSDLGWLELNQEIEAFAKENPNRLWANGVFILSKGILLHGDTEGGRFGNSEIDRIKNIQIYGFPDRDGSFLFKFQSVLLQLLRETRVVEAEIDSYFRLPLIADSHSYQFAFGYLAEFATCPRHGDFQRTIAPDQLEKLINWCRTAEPINYVRAIDIAYGRPDDVEAYKRQPGDVRIYNPEAFPLQDILTQKILFRGNPVHSLAFDMIQAADMTICVPAYYSQKEGIISGCPKCG
ncbi:hypothetical protein NR798_22245 [Archangium gephyra]|uniref:DUF6602 domain-containing protein n=1 Tax=Archangium gephyra TaxID=48 RepID=UPI0035D51551